MASTPRILSQFSDRVEDIGVRTDIKPLGSIVERAH
jgi:hypothetical protein